MMRRISRGLALVLGLAMLLSLGPRTTTAQDERVIQLVVPPQAVELFSDEFLAPFYTQNPGVRVIVEDFNPDIPNAADDLEGHFEGTGEYVQQGDVLLVSNDSLSYEATRAGYWLDLSPLANADPNLNVNDFIFSVWQSFQWDLGVWAVPFSAEPVLFYYNPALFDAAGLNYPDAGWTLADIDAAVRALADPASDPNFELPLVTGDLGRASLMRGSAGVFSLYDPNALPSAPLISGNPALAEAVQTFASLEQDGYFAGAIPQEFNEAAMRTAGSLGLADLPNTTDADLQVAPYPGGQNPILVNGFGVSAGTAFPQESYELTKWLSTQAEIVNRFFAPIPARYSLQGADDTAGAGLISLDLSPEDEALALSAVEGGISVSDQRFYSYLANAVDLVANEGFDGAQALQDVEREAVEALNTADAQAADTVVIVDPPPAQQSVEAGQIVLDIGVLTPFDERPASDRWAEVIDAFVANDPNVGAVEEYFSFEGVDGYYENSDCILFPQNLTPQLNLQQMRNVDPFIDADPNFVRDDVLRGVLGQLQREGLTWAVPISIRPEVMRYDVQQFQQQGVPAPQFGWTVDAFNDAVQRLRPTEQDPAPFAPFGGGESYIILITAYGGTPIDFSTDPPFVSFNDPATVDATRQVLDLANNGFIEYDRLSINIAGTTYDLEERDPALFNQLFNSLTFGDPESPANVDEYAVVTYPQGNQSSAALYSIEALYITAVSENPDACYRFAQHLSNHPELFEGMPARRSLLNTPAVVAASGQPAADFYSTYDAFLSDPNTLIVPGLGLNIGGDALVLYWLFRAYDNYVLADADLQAELDEAQQFATAYLDCTAGLGTYDPALYDGILDYIREVAACAVQIDPSTEPLFGFILGND